MITRTLFICSFCFVAVSGCGAVDRGIASISGSAQTCIDGVIYLQFTSGVTVAYSKDGKIKTC